MRPLTLLRERQVRYRVDLDMRVTMTTRCPPGPYNMRHCSPRLVSLAARRNSPHRPRNFEQVPELTPELATACAGKMIVIAGILTAEGKLEQISVKKSPDPQVNSVVTDALSNWTFQPSQIDGKPVALKIMLGVRLITR